MKRRTAERNFIGVIKCGPDGRGKEAGIHLGQTDGTTTRPRLVEVGKDDVTGLVRRQPARGFHVIVGGQFNAAK